MLFLEKIKRYSTLSYKSWNNAKIIVDLNIVCYLRYTIAMSCFLCVIVYLFCWIVQMWMRMQFNILLILFFFFFRFSIPFEFIFKNFNEMNILCGGFLYYYYLRCCIYTLRIEISLTHTACMGNCSIQHSTLYPKPSPALLFLLFSSFIFVPVDFVFDVVFVDLFFLSMLFFSSLPHAYVPYFENVQHFLNVTSNWSISFGWHFFRKIELNVRKDFINDLDFGSVEVFSLTMSEIIEYETEANRTTDGLKCATMPKYMEIDRFFCEDYASIGCWNFSNDIN